MDTGNTAEAVKCPPPDPATSMEALEAFGFTNGQPPPSDQVTGAGTSDTGLHDLFAL